MTLPLVAQVSQPNRVELMLDKGEDYYTLISAEQNGMVLFRETETLDRTRGFEWEFLKLDTALNQEWRHTRFVSLKDQFLGYDYFDNHLYVLFGKGEYTYEEYWLLKLNLTTREEQDYLIRRIIPVELEDFQVSRDYFTLSGQVNFRPVVLHYNFSSGLMKVLPGIYGQKSELVEVNTSDDLETFNVIMNEKGLGNSQTFIVNTFNSSGEIIFRSRLKPDADYSLIEGRSTRMNNGKQLIAGTYAYRKSKYSRGLFIARVGTADEESRIRYYNYADLKNFFKYMKKKKEARVQDKIVRRREKGKLLKFNYKLMVHDVIELDDLYIAIGEAYYPRYNSYGNYYYYMGYPTSNSRSSYNRDQYYTGFDGYKYTHAVIIGFDKSGNLLWDNVFKIDDVVTYQLEQFVQVSMDGQKITLLYNYDDQIKSKVIEGGQVLDGKHEIDIQLRFEGDRVRSSEEDVAGMKFWYDHNFFAYGVQKIANFENSREVFYVNKVSY